MNDHGRSQARPPRPPLDFPPGCPVGVNANTFPAKLWKLVNDDCYTSITWTNNGTSIGIDALKFKYEVLKRDDLAIFKTKNFSSFVRQLNLYGFRKLTTVHPNSRHCEFSENHAHTHSHHHQISDNIQHFQHSYFIQAHPDLLPRVRRASAAQKRKEIYANSSDTFGILKDRTNLHPSRGQGPYPVSLGLGAGGLLHATQGQVFGLSLIASTSRGSLIATPPSKKFDFSKLCNQQGQLKKFVVIGQQDKIRNGLPFSDSSGPTFLGDPHIMSANAPILEAFNMSPLTNPNSSVGYSLKKVPFNTGISEAESAASFLMNDTFESSPAGSPLSSPQRTPEISDDEFSFHNIESQPSADDSITDISPTSNSASSHLSAPSSSTFLSATNSSSTTFNSSSGPSSSSLSYHHAPSSSSATSFSDLTSSGNATFSTSLGSSGLDDLFCSSASSSDPLSDIVTSAFLSATQEPMPPFSLSLPSFNNADMMVRHQLHHGPSQIMAVHASPIDQMATPMLVSPVGYTTDMSHMLSSTPIVMGNIQ